MNAHNLFNYNTSEEPMNKYIISDTAIRLKTIELFAGVGGFRIGLERASNISNQFGLKIRELREAKNISQEKLSFSTGFHRTYIGMIERGERNISLTNMAVFAKVFELNLSELLNFDTVDSFKKYETKVHK